ncbi:Asp-tRNA(Asn)/Glu-tRNA(Gln) amidotransferase subunit GatC [Ruminococcus sp.]|uniref:Asp-tRNA(Asn)/Glu-tRNA(Gln) amidotransferase subunit GatC n=1 Tax=Ruminococcus sp. TaxID=41978 RepID=UPI002E789E6D|nr:Asp-tRNA(Asn)/Glu-tRNA(Gln) amidotransferase subunit GatC [Ruminococcus sp.]MEE0047273.1 Asp-tRNA(Asn)/Glu-tRNA(Gln) amidotransferase subunit GatC [Ruminococcus sp.]
MNIDIKHIAKLARLRIEDDQLDKFESEMQNIVGMVDKLPDIQDEMTLDPDNPMILRKDVAVQDKFTRQELMQNAPQVKAGCLVVPKTVE